jgi:hypothetical protein
MDKTREMLCKMRHVVLDKARKMLRKMHIHMSSVAVQFL